MKLSAYGEAGIREGYIVRKVTESEQSQPASFGELDGRTIKWLEQIADEFREMSETNPWKYRQRILHIFIQRLRMSLKAEIKSLSTGTRYGWELESWLLVYQYKYTG
jgi:hypothetical protein